MLKRDFFYMYVIIEHQKLLGAPFVLVRINIESILFLKYEDSASYIPSVEDNVQLIVRK